MQIKKNTNYTWNSGEKFEKIIKAPERKCKMQFRHGMWTTARDCPWQGAKFQSPMNSCFFPCTAWFFLQNIFTFVFCVTTLCEILLWFYVYIKITIAYGFPTFDAMGLCSLGPWQSITHKFLYRLQFCGSSASKWICKSVT